MLIFLEMLLNVGVVGNQLTGPSFMRARSVKEATIYAGVSRWIPDVIEGAEVASSPSPTAESVIPYKILWNPTEDEAS